LEWELEDTVYKYLSLLAREYPTVQAASTEIINLQAILALPKGTEHFMSDIHGEDEAFLHILNNASGVIRQKVDETYAKTLTAQERTALTTLIYYPLRKLEDAKNSEADMNEWYKITLYRLIEVCRHCASKYTRSKVRKALPKDFEYIIDELLHTNYETKNKEQYYDRILATIIDIERSDAFIIALCDLIKRLVVDRLHIVGDIYDRGPGADIILDKLLGHHSVDIQWGNHDILWMGAASGSGVCIMCVLYNCLKYNNLDIVEDHYGINLRQLTLFAQETYGDAACFMPKSTGEGRYDPMDTGLLAKMIKAVAIIQFKLEGQVIMVHPEYHMNDRMMLDKIDYTNGAVEISGENYPLRDTDFPTVDPYAPYELTKAETELINHLIYSFTHSEKLNRHIRFLYSKGALYKAFNGNLLFHGCVPMNPDGSFVEFDCDGEMLSGKAFFDYADSLARQAYYAPVSSPERKKGQDFAWFLWCGKNSPLFGRDRITTFERLLIDDKKTWVEEKNSYYELVETTDACERIFKMFGLDSKYAHIVNGHMPVRTNLGEGPLKANGKLIVIDGGFCRAYQKTTGIAGYTMFYNSWGIRVASHAPFKGIQDAIENHGDILSTLVVFENASKRITVSDTDTGRGIWKKISDLKLLLEAYRRGSIKENLR